MKKIITIIVIATIMFVGCTKEEQKSKCGQIIEIGPAQIERQGNIGVYYKIYTIKNEDSHNLIYHKSYNDDIKDKLYTTTCLDKTW